MQETRFGGRLGWNLAKGCTACAMLGTAAFLGGGHVLGQPEEEPAMELYFAEPDNIPESTQSPLSLVGVFPAAQAIESVQAAAAAYRVYLGTPPWTAGHIAPFRAGEDGTVISAYDPNYANVMQVHTPAFTPPGWLDVEVVSLENLATAAYLYDAIQVGPDSGQEGEEEGGGSGDSAGSGGGFYSRNDPLEEGEEELLGLPPALGDGLGETLLEGAAGLGRRRNVAYH